MKKIQSLLIFFILTFCLISSLKSEEISSILQIKQEIKYNENIKYEDINKYSIKENEEESEFDFGLNLDINKEERSLDGIKIDLIFKGIDYGTVK